MVNYNQIKAVDEVINTIRNRSVEKNICLDNLHTYKALSNQAFGQKKNINSEIDNYINKHKGKNNETTIYEDVIMYLERLNKKLDDPFVRKNNSINEARFYDYAYIDKSTWSSMKNGQIVPSKKTIMKLSIGLQLDESEATKLMQKANDKFDYNDIQDLIILALLNLKIYDIVTVIEILEFYQFNGPNFFDCIYDTPEEQTRKRKAHKEKAEKEQKEKLSKLFLE